MTDQATGPGPDEASWTFWIDRGGTFTDVVAIGPDGRLVTHKLLSDNPRRYPDAAVQGIRDVLGLSDDDPIPTEAIAEVRMGTTVATNALLERRGEPTVLVTTAGFADVLRIGYQTRPDLFALDIVLPELLHDRVVELDERVDARGTVLRPLDLDRARIGPGRGPGRRFHLGCRCPPPRLPLRRPRTGRGRAGS